MATLKGDIALVTACRDAQHPVTGYLTITHAALSLIEDTLKRHKQEMTVPYSSSSGPQPTGKCKCGKTWPDADYSGALTALHAIATALGINPE